MLSIAKQLFTMIENVVEEGKQIRKKVSRSSQGEFATSKDRPEILSFIQQSNYDRLPDLVPIRHARMSASPFAFYRGTASIMAYDLSHMPNTGINVQAIGDCHIMNFGGFATPERTLVFDANDFDETHPAPWEWDVKRLATSFVLAGRNNNLAEIDGQELAYTVAQSYRKHMFLFSEMSMLDLWYMKFDIETLAGKTKNETIKDFLDDSIAKAHKETPEKVFYKITQEVFGKLEITDQPPLIYHTFDVEKDKEYMRSFMSYYFDTLQHDRKWLATKYEIVDVALKVVGVGSVGTRCYVVLLMNDKKEPLFLQVKEARQSVLEPYTQLSKYLHQGQRVVEGQRLVQAASDIFLGWSIGPAGRHFYLRQLRDRKVAPTIEHFSKALLTAYARLCGRMLARAHAKTGNSELISSYMGKSEAFEEAISNFATAYADQTEKDYESFLKEIKAGRLAVEKG
ncbi:DUF2252 domain-containing protein [Pinibacter soli]|nr:DUF2252 domain-containing protein [Pinibacter soli]